MRTLASIKTVNQINPIEGKDRIALAIIDGWSVIIQKDQFNVGDKCVYVEIDSVLPERPEFEFLRKRDFRIKTLKMAGVLSQGICFPLSLFETFGTVIKDDSGKITGLIPKELSYAKVFFTEGSDVTKLLGIKQYERTMDIEPEQKEAKNTKHYPEFLMRMKWFRKLVLPKKEYRGFPTFISKTDETRIQNAPHMLMDKREYVATEKVDGQSGTFCLVKKNKLLPFMKDRYEYMVCSRNNRLFQKDSSSFWSVSDRYDIRKQLEKMIGNNKWIAIQGECIASNVQGNKYKVNKPDLYVFNVIFPSGRIGSVAAADLCHQYGFKFVPIIDAHYTLPDTVNEVLDYAHGTSQLYDTLREGIVFRSQDGSRSFKAVDPLFLIKHDE